jgi:tripartite-type tricarboxylate transporter receptor subunit TctC
VKELVSQLKAKPDRYAYALAGNGTAPHSAAELSKLNAGVQMLGVPYKGSAPAVSDTIGGQTQVMFPSFFTALPHVKAGKLKALALAGPKRSGKALLGLRRHLAMLEGTEVFRQEIEP